MKTMSALRATATISAAIVLALLTVQGSLALWNVTATSKSQTVQSADFKVMVKIGDKEQQRLSAGEKIAVAAASGLMPGDCQVTPIRVTNATDAGGTFTVTATATDLKATDTAAVRLTDHLTTSIALDQGGNCTPSQQDNTLSLDKGSSGTFYLSTKLAAIAPATLAGAKASIAFTLTTAQQPR
jgi:hypothetical protein